MPHQADRRDRPAYHIRGSLVYGMRYYVGPGVQFSLAGHKSVGLHIYIYAIGITPSLWMCILRIGRLPRKNPLSHKNDPFSAKKKTSSPLIIFSRFEKIQR
ncbi:hypothetical protein DFH27DRAFT_170082 [Peziza echinospora]|nr:hypothetical protein DFH27DRAFT_170082 [Peziza echinospora]